MLRFGSSSRGYEREGREREKERKKREREKERRERRYLVVFFFAFFSLLAVKAAHTKEEDHSNENIFFAACDICAKGSLQGDFVRKSASWKESYIRIENWSKKS